MAAAETQNATVNEMTKEDYKFGFITDIEADSAPPGLNEDIIRFISHKKKEPDFLLQWRLKSFRHWTKMKEPKWPSVHYPAIDYQDIVYYSAPKTNGPKSLAEVDPEILKTFEKLGVPLQEREMLAGVAVDAVFDSVSVGTTFKKKLGEMGVIFCSFSEAVLEHPDLIEKYLGTVVPYNDNFFAALNSAVFTDGSFCYIPKGVRCPMELSTYFRINAAKTGQFERTLLDRRRGLLRELPGRLYRPHARREPTTRRGGRTGGLGQRRDQIFDRAKLVPRRQERQGRGLQLRDQARGLPGKRLQNFLDPGRNRLGYHLEIPQLYSAGRQFGGRVLLRGGGQQHATGRHGNQDDPRG